jgi:hypothetical protein
MLAKTSTDSSPWYIIPADNKWVARTLVADIISTGIERLDLAYPEISPEGLEELEKARVQLGNE